LEAVRRFEANYPEILYHLYFINGIPILYASPTHFSTFHLLTPYPFNLAFRVFQMFFALMKPLLSPRTVAKLEIYTTPDKWLPVLISELPKDQFPIEFGGSQTGRRVFKIFLSNIHLYDFMTGSFWCRYLWEAPYS